MLDSPVDEIKSKLGVEEVVSWYLQLQRAGRNMKANCPFHNEKTPSFMVSPERQMWHCFGCNEGGDIFTFVMKIEGLEFRDALKLLAEKAGVKLKGQSYNKSESGKKSKIIDVLEMSKGFYQKCLAIKAGKKACDYLLERGLNKKTIEIFQLGYAPDSWDLLSSFLKKKGCKESEIFAAGMTIKKDNGGYYDRFRGRIMFPINNISGQTAGFSSRVMPGKDERQAKYINTPETLVYNKGRILYGLDKTKLAIRKNDLCVMVEGNMDVIASFQAGVENVVATSGTALTAEQIKIIKRYTNNIAFSFDMDLAGVEAAKRSIDLALEEGVGISIIQIPEGKDPADCAKKDPKLWQEAAQKRKKIMDFYFDSAFSKYNSTDIEDKKKIARDLLRIITRISNKIEQAHYLQILSERLEIDEKILLEIMSSAKKRKFRPNVNPEEKEKRDKKFDLAKREDQLQEKLLGLVIAYPQLFGSLFCKTEELFSEEKYGKIYSLIKNLFLEKNELGQTDLEGLRKNLFQNSQTEKNAQNRPGFIWDAAVFKIENEFGESLEDVRKEASVCMSNLKRIKLQKDLKKIEIDIKRAGKHNDRETEKLLIKEFNDCLNKLNKLDE